MPDEEKDMAEAETMPALGERLHSALRLSAIAAVLGIAVEVLFFQREIGISFFLWAVLCIGGLALAARLEGLRFRASSLSLVPLLLVSSATLFLRADPLTLALNMLLTLWLFGVLVRSFRGDEWWWFGGLDLLLALFWVPLQSWILPWKPLGQISAHFSRQRQRRKTWLSILRGLALALPILVVFISLLSAADLVFRDQVVGIFGWLNMESVLELMARAGLILVSGLFFLGAMRAALRRRSRSIDAGGPVERIFTPFIGWVETMVVLSLVGVVFVGFVMIQFKYLFGGEANISAAGYTYAEYARQGFNELVLTAIISLFLVAGTAIWSRRQTPSQTRWFKGLSCLLTVGVGVMLASALVRLLAYEGAYGFTRLRTYSHVFIIWLAVLFGGLLALLLMGKLRHLALLLACVSLGFALSLSLLQVDAFIVRQNAGRLQDNGEIDLSYLLSLSPDAVPELVRLSGELPAEQTGELLPRLACWDEAIQERLRRREWPEFHLSLVEAHRALLRIRPQLDEYQIVEDGQFGGLGGDHGGERIVIWPGGEAPCQDGFLY
jgi:hypothetical protein